MLKDLSQALGYSALTRYYKGWSERRVFIYNVIKMNMQLHNYVILHKLSFYIEVRASQGYYHNQTMVS